jgi:hypothetical protein
MDKKLDDKMTKLVFNIIKFKLLQGKKVRITEFGMFYVENKEVKFKGSVLLKDKLNEDWNGFIERMKKEYKEAN